MKAMEERLRLMIAERDALNNQIEGAKIMLRLLRGEIDAPASETAQSHRKRRGNVKETVLDLIMQSAENGLSAVDCVEVARRQLNIELDRASVSSLLSRLKKDDILFYDGIKYRLKQYAGPRQAA